MARANRIYFDNAATSWPKPQAVYEAADRYLREIGAPAGRGGYRAAAEAEQVATGCRQQASALFGAGNPRDVVFALNGTDALNLAIQGSLSSGGHVITTDVDHNSVLRPLRHLEDAGDVAVTRVACDEQGFVSPDSIRESLRPDTKLVVISHASNVTGAVQPVAQVGDLLSDHEALFLVDAAQSAGHRSCAMESLGADMIATPGHKGLLGPLGTGLLAFKEGVADRVQAIRFGGTGTLSEESRQPETMPEKFEVGNLNLPGIAGLRAGLEFLDSDEGRASHDREVELTGRLLEGLSRIEGLTLYGPSDLENRVGVVSFTLAGYDPQEVAGMLDAAYGIEVRAGLHCAPEIHRRLGTFPTGTVRVSLGVFSRVEEVDTAIEAIGEIGSSAMPS